MDRPADAAVETAAPVQVGGDGPSTGAAEVPRGLPEGLPGALPGTLSGGLPEGLVGFRLRRVHAQFVEAWRAFFAAEGLAITPVQGGVLMLIARHPGLTQTELARRLQIETPTLSEQVKRLVEAGHVEREALPSDRRASALRLTKAGRAAARLIARQIEAQEAAALAPLDAAERRQLAELLGRVLDGRVLDGGGG